jgi:hypothetical protein
MSNPLSKGSDPMGQFSQQLAEIRRMAEEANRKQLTIPVLQQDPPETDPTNMWLLPDGRLRSRHLNPAGSAFIYREWVSTAAGSGTSAAAPAAPPTVAITRQDSWPAIWTQSYRQAGPARTDQGTTRLYVGSSGDSFNGQNRSLIGFDYAAIAAALAGSTVNSVSLNMTSLHTFWDAGADVWFGIHNFTSEPASWGGGLPRRVKHRFVQAQNRPDLGMPLEFATSIRDGTGKGIALEAPNSSRDYYAYLAGIGSGSPIPVLTINYSK